MNARKHVLLDRDGTLIAERNYLARVEDVELLPGAAPGLRLLQEAGVRLVVLTNQSGLGRGYFDWAALNAVHAHLKQLLASQGVSLDGIYVCPHTPDDDCDCRKPRTELVRRAAEELHFDPEESFVIGDKPCDIELGRAIGAVTFLVRTGYGALWEREGLQADYIVDDVLAAARIILGNERHEPEA